MASEELFKDFEGKKEGTKKMEKDTVEIKIRFNKIWLERAIFTVIILMLLVLVFYNHFGKYRCEKGLSEISSEQVIEVEGNQTAKPDVEKKAAAVKEPKKEEVKEEPKTEPETESEKELSGKITLSIEDIELDVNKTKVQSITVKIDNQKKIFTPRLYIYWYDELTEEAVKNNPNGGKINLTVTLYPGQVKQIKLDDELANRRLRTDDTSKEIFRVELYDAKDPVVPIDTKTETKNTD